MRPTSPSDWTCWSLSKLPESVSDVRFRWPPSEADLERLYLVEKLSAAKIGKLYGPEYPKSGETLVLYHLKKFGMARRGKADHVRMATEEMVDERTNQAGEPLKQIAANKVGPATVWNHLREQGVPLRNKVEAQIQSVAINQKLPFAGSEIERACVYGLALGDFHCVRHGRSERDLGQRLL